MLTAHSVTPVAALFLSTAPDFAHYFPFLQPLNEGKQFGAGIATNLVPALLALLFIAVVLKIVTCKIHICSLSCLDSLKHF